jgi:hypothetical protein
MLARSKSKFPTGRAAVNAIVIYESLTGNTRRAAHLIAAALEGAGWNATACPTTDVDYAALGGADLVIVGTWTDGAIFVGQRPGRAGRLRKLPVLDHKRCVVYITYAIDQGRTLEKLQRIVEERGATVLGGMAIRRNNIVGGVHDFVERVLTAVSA